MRICGKISVKRLSIGLCVGALAAFNVWLASWRIETSPINPGARNSAAREISVVAWRPVLAERRLEEFAETVKRPLLEKSRRPFVPTETTPEPGRAKAALSRPEGVRLAGIVQSQGRKRALLVTDEAPQGSWLEEGAVYQGWRVSHIGDGSVRIEAGGTHHDLELLPP